MWGIKEAIMALMRVFVVTAKGTESFAQAFANIGTVAEETSGEYVDTARGNRARERILRERELAKMALSSDEVKSITVA